VPVAISGERAFDASAEASAESPEACLATSAAGGTLRLQAGPINRPEFGPHDLPAQDLELVAQHQQLDVFHMQAATATNKRTK